MQGIQEELMTEQYKIYEATLTGPIREIRTGISG